MTMPCLAEQLGTSAAHLVRPFGYPGRLDESEHVWLTCTGVSGAAAVVLNGQSLGAHEPGDFDHEITPLLGPRNRLELTLHELSAGPVWDEVALEIRRAAFLRAVAHRTGADRVAVRGRVIGPPGLTLELYALVGGRHAHYQLIEPDVAGRPFEFTLDADPTCPTIALDLVQVATSWYAVDVPIT